MQIRGNTSPVPVRVYWPGQPKSRPVPLLVFCIVGAGAEASRRGPGADAPCRDPGAEAWCRSLSEQAGLAVLSAWCDPEATRSAMDVLEWAAEHAAELGADPGRLLVAGEGAAGAVAAAAALEARAQGWPPVIRQVLISPAPTARQAVAGAAPGTVVTVRRHPRGDDGRYAARLRRAGVAVDELRYTAPDSGSAERLLASGQVRTDLSAALHGSLNPSDEHPRTAIR
jgi:acetyl esterase/lipase